MDVCFHHNAPPHTHPPHGRTWIAALREAPAAGERVPLRDERRLGDERVEWETSILFGHTADSRSTFSQTVTSARFSQRAASSPSASSSAAAPLSHSSPPALSS